jgi:indole-3-glycerol phosphate synthase
MDYLQKIIENKREELEEIKRRMPLELLKQPKYNNCHYSLKKALLSNQPAIIAEIKRRSPSKGVFRTNIEPPKLAKIYEKSGTAAISVLTDNHYFGGSLEDIQTVKQMVNIPVLRKDFIIDPYQVYETKYIGADAVLFITSCFNRSKLKEFFALAREIGLEVMIEVENTADIETIEGLEIDIIGVNNRNLHSFKETIETSFLLYSHLPESAVKVSESGLSDAEQIVSLYRIGYRGFLIGETLMRSNNPGKTLHNLISKFHTIVI